MSLEKDALAAINLGTEVHAQIADTKPRNTDFDDVALRTLSQTLAVHGWYFVWIPNISTMYTQPTQATMTTTPSLHSES